MNNYSNRNRTFFRIIIIITILFNVCLVNKIEEKIPQSFNSKSVNAKVMNNKKVYVGGEPLGIQINTKGVLVVGLSDIDTKDGLKTSPATKAGITVGDTILKIKGVEINSGEELSYIINNLKGEEVLIEIEHKGKKINKKVNPIKSNEDDKYKIGLWVRDSTSGIGTLTFYDESTGMYGALGHGIADVDTGSIMSISKGEIVKSEIVSVKKGVEGNPGELKGIFSNEKSILGTVEKNTICGIFGTYEKDKHLSRGQFKHPIEIGTREDIKEGKAQIYTTIEGSTPKLYDIEIQKLLPQNEQNSKSMLIKITDDRLLEKTGGIVQGMSGSPIIQNNKIVGAVTHVLVNKPNTGYGIYIEWMLQECEKVQNN